MICLSQVLCPKPTRKPGVSETFVLVRGVQWSVKSCSAEALRDALSASAPVFASGSPTDPACVCTTRLAPVVVDADDARVRGRVLPDLVGVVRAGQAGADVEELPEISGRSSMILSPAPRSAAKLSLPPSPT